MLINFLQVYLNVFSFCSGALVSFNPKWATLSTVSFVQSLFCKQHSLTKHVSSIVLCRIEQSRDL